MLTPEDKTKEQLTDELARVRQHAAEIADRLNNTLMVVLGNIGLAKRYAESGEPTSKILEKLTIAEEAFTDIRGLIRRLGSLSNQ